MAGAWIWGWVMAGVLWGGELGLAYRPVLTAQEEGRLLGQARQGPLLEQLRAIDRLGRLRCRRLLPILRKLLTQKKMDFRLLQVTILGLGRLGDRASRLPIEAIAQKHPLLRTRFTAIWALSRLRDPASLPVLLRIMNTATTLRERSYAVWALHAYRDPRLAVHLYPILAQSGDACIEAWRILRTMKKLKGREQCSRKEREARRNNKHWLRQLLAPKPAGRTL